MDKQDSSLTPVTEVELPQGVKRIDDRRLSEIMSGYQDFPEPDFFETRSLAYEVRNWRLLSAQTGGGLSGEEREACEGGARALTTLANYYADGNTPEQCKAELACAATLRNIAARGRT